MDFLGIAMARSLPSNPPSYLTDIMASESYQRRQEQEQKETVLTTTLSLKYRLELKNRALALKGGKCFICGYDRCARALEFHHDDPSQKNFSISTFIGQKFWRSGWSIEALVERVWQKVEKELQKCTLLCANCHREVEAGMTELGGTHGA